MLETQHLKPPTSKPPSNQRHFNLCTKTPPPSSKTPGSSLSFSTMDGLGGPLDVKMIVLIGILALAVAIIVIVTHACLADDDDEIHINRYRNRPRRTRTRTTTETRATTTTISNSSSSAHHQLIPTVEEIKDGICAVCLCEFKDGEAIRVLPECMHLFHAECIDMWLSSHSNCPLCRTDIEPPPQHVVLSMPSFSEGGLGST